MEPLLTSGVLSCPQCQGGHSHIQGYYSIKSGEQRTWYHCCDCDNYFSETANTPLHGLRTPLSRISTILHALNEGMGINAACRVFCVSKTTIYEWLNRLGGLKETLFLYALCHQFLEQVIEGDELYTKVYENLPAALSQGWTIVLMDRASRFIWELRAGTREQELFEAAIQTLGVCAKISYHFFVPRFGSDLVATIEQDRRNSRAILRILRLRSRQRWPEDGMRKL